MRWPSTIDSLWAPRKKSKQISPNFKKAQNLKTLLHLTLPLYPEQWTQENTLVAGSIPAASCQDTFLVQDILRNDLFDVPSFNRGNKQIQHFENISWARKWIRMLEIRFWLTLDRRRRRRGCWARCWGQAPRWSRTSRSLLWLKWSKATILFVDLNRLKNPRIKPPKKTQANDIPAINAQLCEILSEKAYFIQPDLNLELRWGDQGAKFQS